MIRRATIEDYDNIVKLIDNDFTKEGYGFVNREQIKSEIFKNRVIVALVDDKVVGVRIGMNTVWNLVVCSTKRGNGIGKALIDYYRPQTIRVKSDPIGHLSNAQKDNFVDPTSFYEKLGFELWGLSLPKNFWQKGKDKQGQFHIKGAKAHIKIYRDKTKMLFS